MAAPAELDRRAREVLKALVQDYIQTGDPVASQALLARHELECSPATVRAVMSDLEALGLLEKPHASSGRIPTAHAYRIYVDTLLKVRPPTSADRDRITSLTADAPDVSRLLEGTADLLHSLSHHAAVVTTPPPRADPVRQVDFVRLRENRVLAVFVSQAGIVTNKLVQLAERLDASDLERAAAYLNERIQAAAGAEASLESLRQRILEDMRADHTALHGLMQKALSLAEQALSAPAAEGRVLVDGEASFLDAPEFADVQKARALLKTFAEKGILGPRPEVQIFIGARASPPPCRRWWWAPYGRAGKVLGTLAVVGPTRANYARVIPLVAGLPGSFPGAGRYGTLIPRAGRVVTAAPLLLARLSAGVRQSKFPSDPGGLSGPGPSSPSSETTPWATASNRETSGPTSRTTPSRPRSARWRRRATRRAPARASLPRSRSGRRPRRASRPPPPRSPRSGPSSSSRRPSGASRRRRSRSCTTAGCARWPTSRTTRSGRCASGTRCRSSAPRSCSRTCSR
jgi:heat-inducible transcriptional repressor